MDLSIRPAEQLVSTEEARETFRARALSLANAGIVANADGDFKAAVRATQDALAYAERHLPGDTIVPWIRSALGSYLLDDGDWRGALEMARSALAYCASVRAPLASLTMAKALLRLGDARGAREYALQACDLRGERVFDAFDPADREAMKLATHAPRG